MKTIQWTLLLLLTTLLWHCEQNEPAPYINPPAEVFNCAEEADACDLVYNNNAFGFDLFHRLHSEDPAANIFISPLSINTALSMTANGMLDDELADVRGILHQDAMTEQQVNEAFKYYLNELPVMAPNVTMLPANSIWYHEDFPFYQDFLTTNQTYFDAAIEARDFRDPATKDEINGWIADKTNDRIQNMIDNIPAEAIMYLINAVYFKGDWRYQFDADQTYTADFTAYDGATQSTPMMTHGQKMTLPYMRDDNFQMVDLPYVDSVFSMSLILPDENVSMDDVINELNADTWNQWVELLHPTEGYVQLPRFKMEYEKTLNDDLRAIGMQAGWSPWGDNRLTEAQNILISLVKHKSFLEVTEEGTEAAAATVVGIELTSVPLTFNMNFNRPFLLVIRERAANGVLFLGKVNSLEE
ncbi:MAG: serpin family protein [Lewinella sp.]|nr:serpin family protein [Lewinella sp.]